MKAPSYLLRHVRRMRLRTWYLSRGTNLRRARGVGDVGFGEFMLLLVKQYRERVVGTDVGDASVLVLSYGDRLIGTDPGRLGVLPS
eukprot:135352-Rhodomonas_salina.3